MRKFYPLQDEAKTGEEGGAGGAGAAEAAAAAAAASAAAGAGKGDDGKGAAGAGAGKGAGEGGAAAPPQDWPTDWVKKLSQDEAVQGRLSRYASPKALAEALISAQDKIRSGALKERVDFPAKGTAEEQAAWRADNGIPPAPDKYDLKFENGLVIGEADKPIVDDFLKAAHAANVAPAAAKAAIGWYFKTLEDRAQAQQQMNETAKEATETALRAEWGGDFAGMRNRIKSLVQMAPPEVAAKIMDARFPDGTAIFNSPEVMRWFGGMAKVLIPNSTIVPGDEATIAAHVEDRLAELGKWMGAPRGSADWKRYWKDDKAQAEYRSLLEHQAATKSKK